MATRKIPGSVYPRPNGRFTALAPEVTDPVTCKPKRPSLGTYATRREAEAAQVLGMQGEVGRVRRVGCEVARDDTRADIIVWAERLTLIIANKVDAGEGPQQCGRLFRHFSSEPNARFVVLTPSGRPPATAGEAAVAAFVPVSYADLMGFSRRFSIRRSSPVLPGGATPRNPCLSHGSTDHQIWIDIAHL